MQVQDLGALDGPVLLFGGPYSNLQATRAIRAVATHRGITPHLTICTGDVVAYCADAARTVAEIRAWGCHVVAGNCEKQLASGATDCGCGFEEGSVCDSLSEAWFAYANRHIGPDDRTWMRERPDIALFQQAGRRCAVIHGGISDISRFLWPVSAEAMFTQEVVDLQALVGDVDVVVAGHCGLAFERKIGSVTWLNAGVIGMPPHTHGATTRYAVMEGGKATIYSLEYDAQAARNAMEQAGLLQGYHRALTSGYWPSEAILPPDLRRSALASG